MAGRVELARLRRVAEQRRATRRSKRSAEQAHLLRSLTDEGYTFVKGGAGMGRPEDPAMGADCRHIGARLRALGNEPMPPGFHPERPPLERFALWVEDADPELSATMARYHVRVQERLELVAPAAGARVPT